jgi:SAM-dependent methyltransferase
VDLDAIRADWSRLGAEDPLWAVYVAPDTRGGRWDLEAFFALGRREVDGVFAELERRGLTPGRRLALDFGCGVGRLSAALAGRMDEVLGVDIAESMLATARALGRGGDRVRYVLNTAPDLSFVPTGSVDLVYSSLVLQHLPVGLARGYLAEFARVLAPGGVAAFQVASRPTRSVKGLAFRLLPWPVLAWAQRRLLGYPAPMRMTRLTRSDVQTALRGTDAVVVAELPDDSYGGHWHYTRYLVTRPGLR